MNRALLGLTLTLALATASAYAYARDDAGAAAAIDGRTLFQAKGCVGCHQHGDLVQFEIGPDLTGLATRADTRVDGLDAAAYVRQSIRQPDAYRVPYFEGVDMPIFDLTEAELDALVHFLLEQETET